MADRICNCGTCDDAAAAALRTFEQMTEQNCPVWASQVGLALGILAGHGISVLCEQINRPNDVQRTIDSIGEHMSAALAANVPGDSK